MKTLAIAALLVSVGCACPRADHPYAVIVYVYPPAGAAPATTGSAVPPSAGYDVDLDGTNEVPRLVE